MADQTEQVQTKARPKNSSPSNGIIFIHSKLDEYGLDPYEFRLYAHIARRGDCFAALKKTAKICGMSVRKIQYVLNVLCKANLIERRERRGRTNVYKLTSPERWVSKTELDAIRRELKIKTAAKEEE